MPNRIIRESAGELGRDGVVDDLPLEFLCFRVEFVVGGRIPFGIVLLVRRFVVEYLVCAVAPLDDDYLGKPYLLVQRDYTGIGGKRNGLGYSSPATGMPSPNTSAMSLIATVFLTVSPMPSTVVSALISGMFSVSESVNLGRFRFTDSVTGGRPNSSRVPQFVDCNIM